MHVVLQATHSSSYQLASRFLLLFLLLLFLLYLVTGFSQPTIRVCPFFKCFFYMYSLLHCILIVARGFPGHAYIPSTISKLKPVQLLPKYFCMHKRPIYIYNVNFELVVCKVCDNQPENCYRIIFY